MMLLCTPLMGQDKALVDEYRDNPRQALQDAKKSFSSGDYKKAKTLVGFYLSLTKDSDQTEGEDLKNRAKACQRSLDEALKHEADGKFSDAADCYERILEMNPNDSRAKKHHDEAIKKLSENNSKPKTPAGSKSSAKPKTEGTRSTANKEIAPAPTPVIASLEAGHEWVDLGVGTKWAVCNVGADYPTVSGTKYAWGETRPKASVTWDNYALRSSGQDINSVVFTKYNTKEHWGPVDNRVRLENADDAASRNWGGRWRTPTKEEWETLINKCTWTWTSVNGVSGYQVTGVNGNSIFLPAVGRNGYYWSASLKADQPPFAWSFVMLAGNCYMEDLNRTCQFMLRAVFD